MSSKTVSNTTSKPGLISSFFAHSYASYIAAALLRAGLLVYGLWQDANSPVKYTDIDYLVFTDAARFTARGQSPYARETYRYTPLLAWMLYPTTLVSSSALWTTVYFSSGKILFAAADLLAGWLLVRILTTSGMSASRARAFAAIWLLNPMVATISTRGSSEGLLGVQVAALVWAVQTHRLDLAALLLGFAVHFKIYPFIYAPAIIWWMDDTRLGQKPTPTPAIPSSPARTFNLGTGDFILGTVSLHAFSPGAFLTPSRLRFAFISLSSFTALNAAMFSLYGPDFVRHTYLHHVSRLDHRHNFSAYNTQLYVNSAAPQSLLPGVESFAFVPQLLLSSALIPLVLGKKDLAGAMLAQTFAFVTFNKVCTSQYFLWYMIFLPLYLPRSTFLKNKPLGIAALVLWVASQGAWLQQGFELEFMGRSTFLPGLWLASLGFFLVNCWILGVMILDVADIDVL